MDTQKLVKAIAVGSFDKPESACCNIERSRSPIHTAQGGRPLCQTLQYTADKAPLFAAPYPIYITAR
jgi:hypothetical protein